jgi:acyl carrier protein
MKRLELIKEIQEILELEDQSLNLDTPLHISSLDTLTLIVFIDEKFDKQVIATQLRKINCIRDLINLIGQENFD